MNDPVKGNSATVPKITQSKDLSQYHSNLSNLQAQFNLELNELKTRGASLEEEIELRDKYTILYLREGVKGVKREE